MNTSTRRRLSARTGLIALALIQTLVMASGCYSKVVDAKGIGGDSTELRKNHEFGSPNPIQDVITREEKRR